MSNPSQESNEGPQRRCVVCRNSERKRALLRFVVAPDGAIHFDVRQRAPGRGIHVCPSRTCLDRAASGAFRRGAKSSAVQLPAGGEWIDALIVEPLWKMYRETLSLGRQSGDLVMGAETVERAARAGDLVAYVLANDASDGTRRKFATNADRKEIPVYGLLSRDALAAILGRDNPVVMGWRAGALATRFSAYEAQLSALAGSVDVTIDGAQSASGEGESR